MKRSGRIVAVIVVALTASSMFAALQRSFVSTTGLDTNPCTRSQPCRDFTAAIGQTMAGGEVYVLDSGGYGPCLISSAITIRAEGVSAGISAVSTSRSLVNGIHVHAGPSDVVTVRGLNIHSIGGWDGILYDGGAALHLQHVTVTNFTGAGIEMQAAGQLFVEDSFIAENRNSGGISVDPMSGSAVVSVDRTRFEHNSVGIAVGEGGRAVVRDSIASGNSGAGFAASGFGTSAELTLLRCVTAGNNSGVTADGQRAFVRMSNVTVTANVNGLMATSFGTIASFGDNQIGGNGVDGTPGATILTM